jgi:cobalt-zinc-cadmium efflux system membrane fusion protein
MTREASLVVLLLSVVACYGAPERHRATAPPGEVWITAQSADDAGITTTRAEEHEIGSVVTAARVAFDDEHVAHVFSPLGGRVVSVSVRLGQKVKKGDALATIDSPEARAVVGEVRKAEADLIAADHDFKRQKDLCRHCTTREVEAVEDNYRAARAKAANAWAKAKLMDALVVARDGYVLRAIIDGEVLALHASPDLPVPDQPTGDNVVPLFTIGDVARVWALGEVHEMDLLRVAAGQKVTLKVPAHPDQVFEGKVDWVSSKLDPTTRLGRVRCTLANPTGVLQPEASGTLIISTSEKKLAVPVSSVVRQGEQSVVFVRAGEGPGGTLRFVRRTVEVVDGVLGEWLPVLEGVRPGEEVVARGALLLSNP